MICLKDLKFRPVVNNVTVNGLKGYKPRLKNQSLDQILLQFLHLLHYSAFPCIRMIKCYSEKA